MMSDKVKETESNHESEIKSKVCKSAVISRISGLLAVGSLLIQLVVYGSSSLPSAVPILLFGLFFVLILAMLVGIISGILALMKIRQEPNRWSGYRSALTGLILSAIPIALFLLSLPSARQSAYRASCGGNLKQVGLVCIMYADTDAGSYLPPLSVEKGKLTFASQGVYTEIITDIRILLCPTQKDNNEYQPFAPDNIRLFNDQSFFYLGYTLTSDREVEAFAEAYREQIAKGGNFKEDLVVSGGNGTLGRDKILRLCNGKELLSKIGELSENVIDGNKIPTVIERIGNHKKPVGGNVLYLDGHVEFLEYPGRWPMTEKTIRILQELDAMGE